MTVWDFLDKDAWFVTLWLFVLASCWTYAVFTVTKGHAEPRSVTSKRKAPVGFSR